jgi:hypothetical protein
VSKEGGRGERTSLRPLKNTKIVFIILYMAIKIYSLEKMWNIKNI